MQKTILISLILFAIVIALLVFNALRTEPLTTTGLTVEYLTNPVGLDVAQPRFSWILESSQRGVSQSAYEVKIARSEADLNKDANLLWSSEKVLSDQSVNIPYTGTPLASGEKYYWRVRVWDQHDETSALSEIQTFQMGLLSQDEWEARWITHPDTLVSAPLMRKSFESNKEVATAYAYVSALGYYEIYLNGEKIGDHVLDPGLTVYTRRVLYETYDVTDQLNRGRNTVGLFLGNGSYRINKVGDRWQWHDDEHTSGTPSGLVQLHVTYADGSKETIVSDGSWKTSSGPITYNNIFGGETYDARLEQTGWSTPEFDDSSWRPVKVVDIHGLVLDSQVMPPIRVTQTLRPVVQTHPDAETYVYDLGQNIPGWWRIRVEGDSGTTVVVRGAETLNDSLFATPLKEEDRISTKHAYHKDVWTTYILKGEGIETYEPRFFYTGYRYLEVKVDPADRLESLEVEGRVVHSDLVRNGHFSSSDSLFNRIHRASVWAQRGNLHSVPTDCPHREKGGYLGDGQVVAEASMHDFHMRPLYQKWLNDMQDAQEENGRIPNTAPPIVGGMGGGVPWGSAHILIPWWMYQYYEDRAILEENYASMKFYLDYLHDLARNDSAPEDVHVIDEFGTYWISLGEWCAPGERNDLPNQPVASTYYWYLNNKTFAEIARVLGKTEDQARALALADSIKEAFNRKFFDPTTNLYGADFPLQTYLLFALDQEMVPEGHREQVMKRLIDDILITRDGHLGTGILGTKHLFRVLTHAGREDIVQTILTKKTYPSYGYWIENGATTLLEQWSGKNSHNHQMFGSVDEYFFKYLAGIRAPTDGGTSTGYRQIHIKPYVPEDLQYAEASIETVRGRVSSRWEQHENSLKLVVTIPANTTGRVSIPIRGMQDIVVTEQGNRIWEENRFAGNIEGISGGEREGNYVTINIGSGTYEFEVAPF